MNHWLKMILVASTATVLAACGGGDDPAPTPPGNLAEVASDAGFNSLVAAATKAGLVPALTDPKSSLTVFAPTDAAFKTLANELGFADGGAMVTSLDAPTLAKILSYHVLPTRKDAAALIAGGATEATLYNFPGTTPTTLAVSTTAGVKLTDAVLNQATVTSADVAASNGVIHVIDKVLVPPGVLNVVQMAQANPDLLGARRSRGRRQSGRYAVRGRPVHGVRADQRSFHFGARRTRASPRPPCSPTRPCPRSSSTTSSPATCLPRMSSHCPSPLR